MTTPLLIALLAGPPLVLLALAIAYAAHVLAQRPALTAGVPPLGDQPLADQPAERPPAPRDVQLIENLQHSIIDLQRQLVAQRDTLTELLSERREELGPDRQTRPIAEPAPADTLSNPRKRTPARSGGTRSIARPASTAAGAAATAGALPMADGVSDAGARQRVRQLLAAGMPERSIARELRIGVEEVQLLATAGGAGRAS